MALSIGSRQRLIDAIDDALPQTQCTRCGYPDCRGYAEAIATGEAPINQCPPGGDEGIARLAALTGRPVLPLNPANGIEAPRRLAVIDEAWCIGCTLCLKACPVDCIVGGPKGMHTVIEAECTGCELCLPACPVDCIAMLPASGNATGWQAWSAAQAESAHSRYGWHHERMTGEARAVARAGSLDHAFVAGLAPHDTAAAKRAAVTAALARARVSRAPRDE
jgi:Na+-translocating ferredoxin:NAD+ oxidoreductase subunit B